MSPLLLLLLLLLTNVVMAITIPPNITLLHFSNFKGQTVLGMGFVFILEGDCNTLPCTEMWSEFEEVARQYDGGNVGFYYVNQTQDPGLGSTSFDPPPPFYRFIENGVPVVASYRAENRGVKALLQMIKRLAAPSMIELHNVDEAVKFISIDNELRNGPFEYVTYLLIIPSWGSVMSVEYLRDGISAGPGSISPYRGKILFGYIRASPGLPMKLGLDNNRVVDEAPCLVRFDLGGELPLVAMCGKDELNEEGAVRRAIEQTRFPMAQHLSTSNFLDVAYNSLGRRILIACVNATEHPDLATRVLAELRKVTFTYNGGSIFTSSTHLNAGVMDTTKFEEYALLFVDLDRDMPSYFLYNATSGRFYPQDFSGEADATQLLDFVRRADEGWVKSYSDGALGAHRRAWRAIKRAPIQALANAPIGVKLFIGLCALIIMIWHVVMCTSFCTRSGEERKMKDE